MKYLRYFGMIVTIFLVLLFGCVVWITQYYDPNNFKPRIINFVTVKTGRQLALGQLHWTFFPRLGLRAEQLSLANSPGFGDKPFVSLKNITISLKLIPLLKKQLEIDALLLDNVQINLIKKASGKGNWQFKQTSPSIASQSNATSDLANNASMQLAGLLTEFGITDFKMTNAAILWHDEQQANTVSLSQLNWKMSGVGIAKQFPVQLDFNISLPNTALLGVRLKTQVYLDQALQLLKLQNMHLLATNAQQQTATLDADANLDLTNQTIQLTNINTRVPQWQTTADPKFKLNDLQLIGTLNILPWQANILERSRFDGQLTINKLSLGNFALNTLSAKIQGKSGILQFAPISAGLYSGIAQGRFKMDLRNKQPAYQIQQTLTGVQLQPLLRDSKVLENFKLSGSGNLTLDLITQGSDMPTLLDHLSGNGIVKINDGVLHGIDLVHWLDVGSALLQRHTPPTRPTNAEQTSFGVLTGSFIVNRGIIRNDDLLLQADWLRATGKGQADLNRQFINYYLELMKINRVTQQPHQDIIPIIISGPFSDVSVKPDLQAIIKRVANQEIEKRGEVFQQRLGDQIEKNFGKNVAEQIKNINLQDLFR